MTAINIFRQRYRISILTDAAGYDSQGDVLGFYAKCAPIPHLRAAIATRGTAVTTALFASNFGFKFRTFDKLVEDGAAFAEELFDESGKFFYSGESEVQIFVAGFSESRNRPESYFLLSNESQGFEPWEWHECDAAFAAPVPSEDELREAGVDVTKQPEDADPVADGLKLMQAQRLMRLNILANGSGSAHVVGGFVLLTEIKPDGVTQRVIHRWSEDRIGFSIEPERRAGSSLQAMMSRQQRRAAERAAKKGRPAA